MGYITIFGGTFNPPHIGHFEIVSALSKQPLVEKILLIPTKVPPHKKTLFLANEPDRLSMLELIAQHFDNVFVSDLEFKREGKSYTIDTLHDVMNLFPNCELALTVGADMLISLPSWKDYESIIKLCKIFTFFRTGEDIHQYNLSIDKLKEQGANIEVIDQRIKGVSSTEVREKISRGEDVSKLLCNDVYHYIESRGVYLGEV